MVIPVGTEVGVESRMVASGEVMRLRGGNVFCESVRIMEIFFFYPVFVLS